ncbi:hypothetical protein [Nitrosomonas europaea]|uniref:hypothetical protein n=1 Tax=Nitrosomonas europaea TaxID=915 RepID=UPI0013052681|nr:hypothetical protein [Nitrosomonas europaea]
MRQSEFTILAEQADLNGADEDVPYSDRRQQFNESGIHDIVFIAMCDFAGARA